jgi:hypothetical protein
VREPWSKEKKKTLLIRGQSVKFFFGPFPFLFAPPHPPFQQQKVVSRLRKKKEKEVNKNREKRENKNTRAKRETSEKTKTLCEDCLFAKQKKEKKERRKKCR